MGERVVAAMSGGVDSSVAAALLARQGYEVIGITLNVWPQPPEAVERLDACCSLAAVEDAQRVAAKLGIPHYTLNFREVFAQTVIADFAAEYRRGRTPNPCIRCNEYIKFGALWQRAGALGATHVATGHYVRLSLQNGRFVLHRSVDRDKDQTYVLYSLTQEQLAHALFPVGEQTKGQVRQLARELGLPVAERPESQDICFVPDSDYGTFLETYCGAVPQSGPIVDISGKVVGQHRGIIFYTVGQRHGLGIHARHRLYVVDIQAETNTIVVGPEEALWNDVLLADRLNLVGVERMVAPLEVTAKIRYRSPEADATVTPLGGDRVEVRFRQPQRAITPGQAVVFYQGDPLVGGATISRAGPRTNRV